MIYLKDELTNGETSYIQANSRKITTHILEDSEKVHGFFIDSRGKEGEISDSIFGGEKNFYSLITCIETPDN